jgi:hypothetical protein
MRHKFQNIPKNCLMIILKFLGFYKDIGRLTCMLIRYTDLSIKDLEKCVMGIRNLCCLWCGIEIILQFSNQLEYLDLTTEGCHNYNYDLEQNMNINILKIIPPMPSLKYLYYSYNKYLLQINGNKFPNLQKLKLHKMENLRHLKGYFPNLKILDCHKCYYIKELNGNQFPKLEIMELLIELNELKGTFQNLTEIRGMDEEEEEVNNTNILKTQFPKLEIIILQKKLIIFFQ